MRAVVSYHNLNCWLDFDLSDDDDDGGGVDNDDDDDDD